MSLLAQLSPAETLLILQGKNVLLKDLLKVTFMDLLLKQVLQTLEVERQPSKHDPVRTYLYVGKGKNFFNYRPLPHEMVFLKPFIENNLVQILFRNAVKIGYDNAQGKPRYQFFLLNTTSAQSYFSRNVWQYITGGFSLSPAGIEAQNKIQSELVKLEETFNDLLKTDPSKALEILKTVKGNIFLLKTLQFSLLANIDKELAKEMERRDTSTGSGCSGYIGCATWTSFDTYSHSFDTSCSSDSGSGCSGCTGDGGCSGCGGCGGD